jgi:hypothetical protein
MKFKSTNAPLYLPRGPNRVHVTLARTTNSTIRYRVGKFDMQGKLTKFRPVAGLIPIKLEIYNENETKKWE